MSIGTSLNQSLAWPPAGMVSTEKFSWTPTGGAVFLGFDGSSDAELDQLSIVTVTFQPASWVPLSDAQISVD